MGDCFACLSGIWGSDCYPGSGKWDSSKFRHRMRDFFSLSVGNSRSRTFQRKLRIKQAKVQWCLLSYLVSLFVFFFFSAFSPRFGILRYERLFRFCNGFKTRVNSVYQLSIERANLHLSHLLAFAEISRFKLTWYFGNKKRDSGKRSKKCGIDAWFSWKRSGNAGSAPSPPTLGKDQNILIYSRFYKYHGRFRSYCACC